jgi:hypothetical protein
MLPTEKKAISKVLEKHNKEFGVERSRELHRSYSIPIKDMQSIRLGEPTSIRHGNACCT